MDKPKNVRVETDTFGPIEVEAHRYWGAQTQRSLQNFKIGGERMSPPWSGRWASSSWPPPGSTASSANSTASSRRPSPAAQEVVDGKLTDEFPLVVWQTGSGTQTNMNANEVIASRANEILGGERGGKSPVHPNDHVNRGQSSNDTFPTTMHVAAAEQTVRELCRRSSTCMRRSPGRARSSRTSSRSGGRISRTRRLDARAGVLGLRHPGRLRDRAGEGALPRVYQLAQGGTAVGTGLNAKKGFAEAFAAEVAAITGLPFVTAPNKFEALAAHDAMVELHGAQRAGASLMKIANDIRLWAPARAAASASSSCRRTSPAARSCRARSTRPSPRR